jgi:murein L,D-transpeptidase YcbB/YkuD
LIVGIFGPLRQHNTSDNLSSNDKASESQTNHSPNSYATNQNQAHNTQAYKTEKAPVIDFVKIVTNKDKEGIFLYNSLVKANQDGLIKMLTAMDNSNDVSVKDLQLILKLYGLYNGRIDGKYGKNTRLAVINYKKLLNFSNSSELDETFNRYMRELKQFSRSVFSNLELNNLTVIANYSQLHVFEAQGFLYTFDLYNQEIDGLYNEETIKAIKKFQGQIGMRQDGLISKELLVNLHVIYCFCYVNSVTTEELNYLLKFRYINNSDSIIMS